MVVVSDTSIITGLLAINKLSILAELFDQVLISVAVYTELSCLKDFGYNLDPLQQDWLKRSRVKDLVELDVLLNKLDLGEAESILLAIDNQADYLLIDEKKGRRIATEYGIKVMGLLGILIQAKRSGLISALKPELELLRSKLEFRLSPNLINEALAAVGEK
ncbi:MAG: DUF3368 domain-containing protein [Bacteroidales bacterium]|nr:DUF3368 domain-containing protein [Bacteroidales bacterium]MCF8454578.1 DUF3368 domain-containing protein [Bacteroidales bacterium]